MDELLLKEYVYLCKIMDYDNIEKLIDELNVFTHIPMSYQKVNIISKKYNIPNKNIILLHNLMNKYYPDHKDILLDIHFYYRQLFDNPQQLINKYDQSTKITTDMIEKINYSINKTNNIINIEINKLPDNMIHLISQYLDKKSVDTFIKNTLENFIYHQNSNIDDSNIGHPISLEFLNKSKKISKKINI